jgi:hypothetical protein
VIELTRERLRTADGAPLGHRQAGRFLLKQIELLWRRRIIDYVLLQARKP